MAGRRQSFGPWLADPRRAVLRRELQWTLRWTIAGWGAAALLVFFALRVAQLISFHRYAPLLAGADDWLAERLGGVVGQAVYFYLWDLQAAITWLIPMAWLAGRRTLAPFRSGGEATPAGAQLWPALLFAPVFFAVTLHGFSRLIASGLPVLFDVEVERPFSIELPMWLGPADFICDAAGLVFTAAALAWIALPGGAMKAIALAPAALGARVIIERPAMLGLYWLAGRREWEDLDRAFVMVTQAGRLGVALVFAGLTALLIGALRSSRPAQV